jgi:hypothetical protein
MLSPITLIQQFSNKLRNQWTTSLEQNSYREAVHTTPQKILTLTQSNFHRLLNDSPLTVRIQSHFNPVHVLIAVYLRHIYILPFIKRIDFTRSPFFPTALPLQFHTSVLSVPCFFIRRGSSHPPLSQDINMANSRPTYHKKIPSYFTPAEAQLLSLASCSQNTFFS